MTSHHTQVKSYKLIPLKKFEDLINIYNKNNESSNTVQSSDIAINNSPTQISAKDDYNSNRFRNIQGIREKSLSSHEKNNIVNTSHNSNLSGNQISNPKTLGDGLSANDNNNIKPFNWVYSESDRLPQFSQQNKLQDSYDKYNEILNSKDISDSLKLKLLSIVKQKYDDARLNKQGITINETDDEDDYFDDDDNYDAGQPKISKAKIAIANILTNSKSKNLSNIDRMSKLLMEQRKYILWDRRGKLIKPAQYYNHPTLDIAKIIDILISKRIGKNEEVKLVISLIKPFYKYIKHMIKNPNIIEKIELWEMYKNSSASKRNKNTKNYIGLG